MSQLCERKRRHGARYEVDRYDAGLGRRAHHVGESGQEIEHATVVGENIGDEVGDAPGATGGQEMMRRDRPPVVIVGLSLGCL